MSDPLPTREVVKISDLDPEAFACDGEGKITVQFPEPETGPTSDINSCEDVLACLDTNGDGKIDALLSDGFAGPFETSDISTYTNQSGTTELVWMGGTVADPEYVWVVYSDGSFTLIKKPNLPISIGAHPDLASAKSGAVAAGDGFYCATINGCTHRIDVCDGVAYTYGEFVPIANAAFLNITDFNGSPVGVVDVTDYGIPACAKAVIVTMTARIRKVSSTGANQSFTALGTANHGSSSSWGVYVYQSRSGSDAWLNVRDSNSGTVYLENGQFNWTSNGARTPSGQNQLSGWINGYLL